MKITMLTVGSTWEVRPYILLGRELLSRGHRITIATFSRFREDIEAAGLSYFPLSGDAEEMMAAIMSPHTGALRYLPRLEKSLKTVAPLLIRDMSDSCTGADAMICNFFGSIYYSIAEKHRIPCIQTHYFPMDPTREIPLSVIKNQRMAGWMNASTYRLGYLLISGAEKRYLSSWRRENDVSPRKLRTRPDYRVGDHPVPVIYAISPRVLPRPAEWPSNIHMSGFWFEDAPCAYTPPEDLARFLAEGPTPVYIGFGSMNAGDMNRLLAMVMRALHASGLRAVISLGWSGEHYPSGRRVFFAGGFVPHDWLFPRVRAIVHHGGAGTTASGFRWGRPALVIPFSGDQAFWGSRVRALGCGPKPIPRDSLTVHRLTRALLDLTGQKQYQENAAALARALQEEHGVRQAADLILREIAAW